MVCNEEHYELTHQLHFMLEFVQCETDSPILFYHNK